MHTLTAPDVENVRILTGIAGQRTTLATVTYAGESSNTIGFAWSVYGGPVVVITTGLETFVSSAVVERLGHTVDETWVRRFFA